MDNPMPSVDRGADVGIASDIFEQAAADHVLMAISQCPSRDPASKSLGAITTDVMERETVEPITTAELQDSMPSNQKEFLVKKNHGYKEAKFCGLLHTLVWYKSSRHLD
jgi:hypothetical protein